MEDIAGKRKRRKNRIVTAAIMLSLVMTTLTGCFPNHYTREEENAFLREAQEVASDYLSDRYDGAEIREIEPETVLVDKGYELTEFASGQFVWQSQNYHFVVNAETGEVYTSVQFNEIRERLKEEVFGKLDLVAEETAVEDCTVFYLKYAEAVGNNCFRNVFPEESTEELVEKILRDTEAYRFNMLLQYKGEDIPPELMEQEAPFPTLTGISLYHVAQEHAFYEGEYGYSTLPSLSKEILELKFSTDAASYTRYQTLEQNGLRVAYKAYERTREQDTVTETVITEDDITLTVTDECIRLDCARDNYSMYLFTEDKEIAEKYRYIIMSNRINTKKEMYKGMWYPFEDGYVLADNVYVQVPYEICPYYAGGNVIYSSPPRK